DRRLLQRLARLHGDVRADEAKHHLRVAALQRLRNLDVIEQGGRAGMDHRQLVAVRHAHHVVDGEVVGRGVDQLAAGDAGGGLGKPGGIPEGPDPAPRLVARAGPAIETLERRGIQEESLFHHPSPYPGGRVVTETRTGSSQPRTLSPGWAGSLIAARE